MRSNLNISDYRYERKFFITELSKYEVESIVKLHSAFFSKLYNKRFINNIYFDSYNFNNLRENVDGVSDRIKIRIRWYGDLYGYIKKPILEIKIKNGQLGKKISVPIKSFHLTKYFDVSEIMDSIKDLKEIIGIDFVSLIPSLLNRYSRKYYQSCNGHYRITIDSDQSFYEISKKNNFFLNRIRDKNSVILELKYAQVYDSEASYITTEFPFRITKSSKYVTGLENVLQVNF
jgi:hypothetical protein